MCRVEPNTALVVGVKRGPFFLKTYDIAVLLDVSPDDVNAMARKGLIKGHKIGKQWRFRNKDVIKILDQKRNQMMFLGGFENLEYGR